MAYGGVTGYTAGIVNGSIKNAREYLMLCIRNFMCCIDQREDSLNAQLVTEYKPDKYYFKSYKEAVEELDRVENMTFDEIEAEYVNHLREKSEYEKRMYNRMVDEYAKYKRILDEVEKWMPPTEEHEAIKSFAINQIKMCMPTEDEIEERRLLSGRAIKVSDDDIRDWYNTILGCAKRHVEIRGEMLDEQIKIAHNRTEFLRKFIDSLPKES